MHRKALPLVLALCVSGAAALPAAAQDGPPYRALRIPLPEKAEVSVEIDAHQEDLLGVMKSMLKGLNLPALMRMMQGMGAETGIKFPDAAPNGEPLPPPGVPGGAGAPPGVALPATAQLAPNFADMLKNVNQLHMVVFKAEGWTPDQAIKFYEQPFGEEGGRRVIWINQGEMRMLMFGFHSPRGFAVVIPTKDEITVIRADGYPDLEGVGSFVTLLGAMVGSMRNSMSDIFGGGATAEPTEPPTATPAPPSPPIQRGIKRRPASLVAPKPAHKAAARVPARR